MPTGEYRDLYQRLADWQRAELWRQRRTEEMQQASPPDYHGQNLLARPGVSVHVDSFLGTINTDRPEDGYWPLYEVAMTWTPGPGPGELWVQLGVEGPNLGALTLSHNGVPVAVNGTTAHVSLVPGRNGLLAQAISAPGWRGRASRLVFDYAAHTAWPQRPVPGGRGQRPRGSRALRLWA